MTLQQIYYVITAANAGSMNQAAQRLFISQPTLTSAIHQLETELGITIFNRSSRGISLTKEGEVFLNKARQLYAQYEILKDSYGEKKNVKRQFRVSCQHYSFAVKAFADMVNSYDTSRYAFEIKETQTLQVIDDVKTGFSEIGILYMSDYNRKYLKRLLDENDLVFTGLVSCDAAVYLWKGHPLAAQKAISFEELKDYPCLSFDQGGDTVYYLAEEILAENEYPRIVKISDRATALNLLRSINGYMLCSGIIDEDLNGSEYIAVPYEPDQNNPNSIMEIGYIMRRHALRSEITERYIQELQHYLAAARKG